VRILYLNYEWDLRESSGAATHIHELSTGLRRLGHDVVLCERRRGPNADARRPAVRGRPFRQRLAPFLHESAAMVRALANVREEGALLDRERPDVVLTRYSLHQLSSLLAARRRSIPIVFEVNGPPTYEYRRYHPQYWIVPGFGDAIERWTFRRANGMFVVSTTLKDYFVERGVPADRITVIPNGADPTVFRPDVVDRTLRSSYDTRDVVVAFVGSFGSFHGIETLKHVVAAVVPRDPHVKFLFIGEGPRSAELRTFCAAHALDPHVRFTGYVPRERVPSLMAAADILVAPYEAEPFFYFSPIKLFEYMATGRAVVAARLGQIAEIVHDGVDGLLYDPADPNDLAAKLLRLGRDPRERERLGRAARAVAEQQYSWDVNASRVATLLEGVVAGCERGPSLSPVSTARGA
jgi:glycosyltransferase involved in cell wall biosynthesis